MLCMNGITWLIKFLATIITFSVKYSSRWIGLYRDSNQCFCYFISPSLKFFEILWNSLNNTKMSKNVWKISYFNLRITTYSASKRYFCCVWLKLTFQCHFCNSKEIKGRLRIEVLQALLYKEVGFLMLRAWNNNNIVWFALHSTRQGRRCFPEDLSVKK